MMRFELITLAGPVFETGAYTVPPHRLVFCWGDNSTGEAGLSMLFPDKKRAPKEQNRNELEWASETNFQTLGLIDACRHSVIPPEQDCGPIQRRLTPMLSLV